MSACPDEVTRRAAALELMPDRLRRWRPTPPPSLAASRMLDDSAKQGNKERRAEGGEWVLGRFKGQSRAVKVEWYDTPHWSQLNDGDVFVVLRCSLPPDASTPSKSQSGPESLSPSRCHT